MISVLRNILSTTVLCCAFTAALPAQVQPSLHEIASRVDAHYNHMNTLRLDYTERYTGMGITRSESGTLLLKKPGRMRWNYATPIGKVFILDGKSAYFYTPGDLQAQRLPAKQLDDMRSPLRFLLGHTQLEKELTNITLSHAHSGVVLSGVPKGMEQRIHALSVTCDPATGIISDLRLEEIDGAVTEFHFTNLHENIPLNDSEFRFVPPEGVVIIDGLPPS